MNLIALDFDCPTCGVFDVLVERPAPETHECPECHQVAAAALSPLRIKRQLILDVKKGKVDPCPTPTYLDTEPLADGMDPVEFQAKRDKVWEDYNEARIKKMVS